MLNWMLAKQKHIHKYATIYLDQGFDVLSVSCTPWQLLWPMKGSQVTTPTSENKTRSIVCPSDGWKIIFFQLVASDTLRFLTNNPNYNPMILHGFSIGGYVWGELLFCASGDKERFVEHFRVILKKNFFALNVCTIRLDSRIYIYILWFPRYCIER
jgi:hypothetical protein